MLRFSDEINEIALALSICQGKFEHALKDTANPFFKSKYATLAGVIAVAKPYLAEQGLAVTQHPRQEGGTVYVETMLVHKSGQWMRSECSAPIAKMDAQGVGSAITYLRRYAFSAILGIAQEDDDGNQASKSAPTQKKPPLPHERFERLLAQKTPQLIERAKQDFALTDDQLAQLQ